MRKKYRVAVLAFSTLYGVEHTLPATSQVLTSTFDTKWALGTSPILVANSVSTSVSPAHNISVNVNPNINVTPTINVTPNINVTVSPNTLADASNSKTYHRIDMDVLLEGKAAYFLPTDTAFKNMYGKGGAMYGVEITFKLHKRLFGWLSADFFTKHGTSLRNGVSSCAGISTCCQVLTRNCNATKLTVIPLAAGLKYFIPFATARQSLMGDLYLGLGIEPVYLSSTSQGCLKCTQVGLGGIAKIGVYFELPQNFFIDLFADYSLVSIEANGLRNKNSTPNPSGFIFGAGIGYRFN